MYEYLLSTCNLLFLVRYPGNNNGEICNTSGPFHASSHHRLMRWRMIDLDGVAAIYPVHGSTAGCLLFFRIGHYIFFALWSECLGFMEHTSHAQFIFTMALCKCMLRLRPPTPGVGPCSPLLKVQTLQLWASHFIRVTLGIDISVSRRNRKDINKYQCQFF